MKRTRLSRSKSRTIFRNTVNDHSRINFAPAPQRGGFRL